jgi:hypothetical protein
MVVRNPAIRFFFFFFKSGRERKCVITSRIDKTEKNLKRPENQTCYKNKVRKALTIITLHEKTFGGFHFSLKRRIKVIDFHDCTTDYIFEADRF